MNSPMRFTPPRPFSSPRKKPRSRPEAAAELVRMEYERDRLERDLATIEHRRTQVLERLEKVNQRAQALAETLT